MLWLALGIRALDLGSEAQDTAERLRNGPVPQARVNDSLEGIRDARFLSPDGESLLIEGELLVAAGRAREADAVAGRLVKSEPDNDRAWFFAYLTASEDERPRTLRRLAELNPWAADGLR